MESKRALHGQPRSGSSWQSSTAPGSTQDSLRPSHARRASFWPSSTYISMFPHPHWFSVSWQLTHFKGMVLILTFLVRKPPVAHFAYLIQAKLLKHLKHCADYIPFAISLPTPAIPRPAPCSGRLASWPLVGSGQWKETPRG